MAVHNKQSLARHWEDYHATKSTLAMACVATAVATMIAGFSWGGWVTGGTAQNQAETAGDLARAELASEICVERFNVEPNAAAMLVELKGIADSYKKRQFVEDGGWATMPGQSSANRRGAEACATALSA